MNRDTTRADMVEGYDDYLLGKDIKDCPYPENNLNCKTKREAWIFGWRKAQFEIESRME